MEQQKSIASSWIFLAFTALQGFQTHLNKVVIFIKCFTTQMLKDSWSYSLFKDAIYIKVSLKSEKKIHE